MLAWRQTLAALFLLSSAAAIADESVGDLLRRRLEAGPPPLAIEVAGEPIRAGRALPQFYQQRLYAPAWSRQGRLRPAAGQLIESLEEAPRDGLEARHYHWAAVTGLIARLRGLGGAERDRALADLDLLLTDAFLIYGAHLVSGRLDPATFDPEWIATRREVDLVAALERALEAGDPRPELQAMLPNHDAYFRLREALADYRRLLEAGGWEPIAAGPSLRVGDSGPRVAALRRRLRVTGDLVNESGSDSSELFDEALAEAVRRFQARHGLQADAVVGDKTLAALNAPAHHRVRQLELNLERWRWLPQSLGQRHVLVNLPAFEVRLVDGEEVTLGMRAVVGRPYRRTPVFSDAIRYLVFNPYWEIPAKIAIQDKLPEIRRDPDYLARQKIRLFQGWGAGQSPVDPAAIDWSALGAGKFPYRLRQDPGPLNALGRVKFMFPNRFNVYLHDTPTREVFQRAERDVSSGCIRLERPLELAEELLRQTPGWDRPRIDRVLAGWQETVASLASPVPVHLLHWSAWVEPDGTVNFRADLYGRDDRLSAALASLDEAAGG